MAAGTGLHPIEFGYNINYCNDCNVKISWTINSTIYSQSCECKPTPKIKKIGKSKYFNVRSRRTSN